MSAYEDTEREFTERLPLGSYIHRFVDTKAARNLVQGQPADYLICPRGGSLLSFAEVKLCNNPDRFPLSNLQLSQKSTMAQADLHGFPYHVYIKSGWRKTWYKISSATVLNLLSQGRKSITWDELENYKWA